MQDNPYAPPKANLDAPLGDHVPAPALWNPNAAASWCLLFSPVFGIWLHMKNWEAMGEPEKARQSKLWLTAAIVVLLGLMLGAVFFNMPLGRLASFALLIGWYYAAAKPQVRTIADRYGSDYPRKGWLVPIGIAIGAFVGIVVVLSVLVILSGVEA